MNGGDGVLHRTPPGVLNLGVLPSRHCQDEIFNRGLRSSRFTMAMRCIDPSSLTTVPNVIGYNTNGSLDFVNIVAARARDTPPEDAPTTMWIGMKHTLSRMRSRHVEDATNVLQYQEVNGPLHSKGHEACTA